MDGSWWHRTDNVGTACCHTSVDMASNRCCGAYLAMVLPVMWSTVVCYMCQHFVDLANNAELVGTFGYQISCTIIQGDGDVIRHGIYTLTFVFFVDVTVPGLSSVAAAP
eukprot:jgi/Chrzof1/11434/Cz05g36170.t1